MECFFLFLSVSFLKHFSAGFFLTEFYLTRTQKTHKIENSKDSMSSPKRLHHMTDLKASEMIQKLCACPKNRAQTML